MTKSSRSLKKESPFLQRSIQEYTDTGVEIEQLCQKVGKLDFSLILKNRKLDSWRQACP
jgi:hypothetical protein